MKLEITYHCPLLDPLGRLEAQEIWSDRNVFIDDKEVPSALKRIILLGIDVAAEQYLDLIEMEMKKEGHLI